jgi:hypothetical protein
LANRRPRGGRAAVSGRNLRVAQIAGIVTNTAGMYQVASCDRRCIATKKDALK